MRRALNKHRLRQGALNVPPDAPWQAALVERIAEASRRLVGAQPPPSRGPTPDDVAATEKLSSAERAQMIAAMVDGLAQRLKRNGKDLSGWLRLVNAYVVLDRKDDPRTVLGKARKQFTGDAKALGELSSLAASLGLGS